jgi:hypothetical protein
MTRTRSLTVAVTTLLKTRTCKENRNVGKKFDRKKRKQRNLRKIIKRTEDEMSDKNFLPQFFFYIALTFLSFLVLTDLNLS